MKRIDPTTILPVVGSTYPPPFDQQCKKRERQRLGDAAGLTQFGVNLLRWPPNTWSSQRHWHILGDEFVYVLSGEVVLVTNDGGEVLRAGDAAGFEANEANGHCLQNRADVDALILQIGTRLEDPPSYPDIDLMPRGVGNSRFYVRRDGTPYITPEACDSRINARQDE
jgi:uncharacterized cupin superfamily protein